MEKTGSGTRLTGLPFEVEEAKVPTPDNPEEVARFRPAFEDAQDVLDQALQAVVRDDKESFLRLFVPEKATPTLSRSESAYNEMRSLAKYGYSFRTSSFGTLDTRDIQAAAARFSKDGSVRAFWRRIKGDSVLNDSVWFRKVEDQWRIERW
jgi:hypothetical protein